MKRIRIVVADDHPIVRDGLRTVINGQPDMEVVGEASDGREAVALAERVAAPEIVLLDLTMPGGEGLPSIRLIKEKAPRTRVLVLTMHEEPAIVAKSSTRAARGFW